MKNLILAGLAGLLPMACTSEPAEQSPDSAQTESAPTTAPVGEVKLASLALTGST